MATAAHVDAMARGSFDFFQILLDFSALKLKHKLAGAEIISSSSFVKIQNVQIDSK